MRPRHGAKDLKLYVACSPNLIQPCEQPIPNLFTYLFSWQLMHLSLATAQTYLINNLLSIEQIFKGLGQRFSMRKVLPVQACYVHRPVEEKRVAQYTSRSCILRHLTEKLAAGIPFVGFTLQLLIASCSGHLHTQVLQNMKIFGIRCFHE